MVPRPWRAGLAVGALAVMAAACGATSGSPGSTTSAPRAARRRCDPLP
ncbi:MAG TPA: hypothetical protein VLZ77_14495 [Acidimicrobiales bacterium]|nr:hypothetical protein [Acidimicrobiales bacterium]